MHSLYIAPMNVTIIDFSLRNYDTLYFLWKIFTFFFWNLNAEYRTKSSTNVWFCILQHENYLDVVHYAQSVRCLANNKSRTSNVSRLRWVESNNASSNNIEMNISVASCNASNASFEIRMPNNRFANISWTNRLNEARGITKFVDFCMSRTSFSAFNPRRFGFGFFRGCCWKKKWIIFCN